MWSTEILVLFEMDTFDIVIVLGFFFCNFSCNIAVLSVHFSWYVLFLPQNGLSEKSGLQRLLSSDEIQYSFIDTKMNNTYYNPPKMA